MVSAQTLSSIQLSENWRQGLFVIDVGFWSHRVDNYWHGDVHRPAKVEAPTRPEAGADGQGFADCREAAMLSEPAGRVWCLGGRHPVTRPQSVFTVFSSGSGTRVVL